MFHFNIGDCVSWNLNLPGESGTIRKRYTTRVERYHLGKIEICVATCDDPAFLIEKKNGGKILKCSSDLEAFDEAA